MGQREEGRKVEQPKKEGMGNRCNDGPKMRQRRWESMTVGDRDEEKKYNEV